MSAVIAAQNWKDIHFGEVAGLIIAAAAGVPLGVYLLAHAPKQPLLIALGIIIAFALFSLLRPQIGELKDRRWRYAAGFASGVLGAIVASFIGRRIATRLSPEMLSKAVYGLCLVLGVVILATNLGA